MTTTSSKLERGANNVRLPITGADHQPAPANPCTALAMYKDPAEQEHGKRCTRQRSTMQKDATTGSAHATMKKRISMKNSPDPWGKTRCNEERACAAALSGMDEGRQPSSPAASTHEPNHRSTSVSPPQARAILHIELDLAVAQCHAQGFS